MRRGLNIILIISLMLTFQQNILAQDKGAKESPRAMVQRLQKEIEKLQDDLAENPSSSEAEKIKSRIQWNIRKIREISPDIKQPAEFKTKAADKIKGEKAQTYGVERYTAIIKNNLFTPLGTTKEVRRQEFVLTGILGKSAFIQLEGSSDSYYVTEGQSFSKDARLASVGENSVTIIHEGTRKELTLNEGKSNNRSGGAKGGSAKEGNAKGGAKSSKKGFSSSKKMEANRRAEAEKKRIQSEKKPAGQNDWARNMSIDELSKTREDIGRYIEGLEKKGVTNPEEYEGAYKKMETVERAIAEKEESE